MRHAALLAPLVLAARPAEAHVGHLGELAGHDHWVAGAALGAAALVGLWGALKGLREAGPEADGQADGAPIEPAEAEA